MHNFTILAGPDVTTRGGARVRRSTLDIFTDLAALRDTNAYVPCVDENERSFDALLEAVEEVTPDPNTRNVEPGRVYRVTLAE